MPSMCYSTGGTGGKFQPVSIMESHVLTLAARSYALLVLAIALYTHFEQSYLVSWEVQYLQVCEPFQGSTNGCDLIAT